MVLVWEFAIEKCLCPFGLFRKALATVTFQGRVRCDDSILSRKVSISWKG